MRLPILLSLGATIALTVSPVSAQQRQPTPEQRIDRLERQLRQVQGRVFVKGQPADTATFDYEPAATMSSVTGLADRLNSLERQMAEILRQSEENGHRLGTMQSDVARMRTSQDERFAELERRIQEAAAARPAPLTTDALQPAGSPPATRPRTEAPAPASKPPVTVATEDPGEDAYSEGYRLWQAGNHQQAISSLRSFVGAYPKHRRVSYANNLIGRSLLDSGQASQAADTFLSNYRSLPNGERAPDSLYYLGQALMKLGHPQQACNAYEELERIYTAKIRPDLRKLLNSAREEARCS